MALHCVLEQDTFISAYYQIQVQPRKTHLDMTEKLLTHGCKESNQNHQYANVSLEKYLSYDFMSGSEITPCNKIDYPLVIYRFLGNVMTSITTLRT